jgi:hypothetical protein
VQAAAKITKQRPKSDRGPVFIANRNSRADLT